VIALISGITGQDGALLAKFLLDKEYKVYGTYRRLSTPNFWRLQDLKILNKVKLIPADLLDDSSLIEAVREARPDEVYNLAANSFVGASFEQPILSGFITGIGAVRMLEAIRQTYPRIRYYQASTSELYGSNGKDGTMQNELTPFAPSSPYATAKLYAYWATRNYRESYDIFAVNGILFNHEGSLRGLEFVTRKVTNAVARINLGLQSSLELGNMEAKRDWGWATEYVESMWLMMQQHKPDDYVIATGETHSVRELVELAFSHVGLDWKEWVRTDNRFIRPVDVNCLCGDSSKAKKVLGWEAKVKFKELIELMVDSDLDRWERYTKGEHFPWDAPNYTEEADIVSIMKNRGG
jgi:GDPmannose 4,6-dehydratase